MNKSLLVAVPRPLFVGVGFKLVVVKLVVLSCLIALLEASRVLGDRFTSEELIASIKKASTKVAIMQT